MESYCPSCGELLSKKAEFCRRCGLSLRGGERTPVSLSQRTITGSHRVGTASWEDLRKVMIFYSLIMGSSLAFGLTARFINSIPELELAETAVFIILTLVFLVMEWGKVSWAFRLKRAKPKTLLALLVVCVGTFLFLQFYFGLFSYFKWPMITMSESYLKEGWPLWSIFAMICVEPGIVEETAFRGIIQTRLAKILSRRESILIQAALFSAMHLSPAIFVSHFVMGLLLGWVRLRTGHVYYGMLLHMGWNAFVVLQELGKIHTFSF